LSGVSATTNARRKRTHLRNTRKFIMFEEDFVVGDVLRKMSEPATPTIKPRPCLKRRSSAPPQPQQAGGILRYRGSCDSLGGDSADESPSSYCDSEVSSVEHGEQEQSLAP